MNDSAEDARILARAGTWDGAARDALAFPEITREHGLDFATAVLYERLARVPANAEFLRDSCAAASPSADTLIGVVPGAFYREHRNTGADGARVLAIAEKLGLPAEVIPTASFGTLAENAMAVHRWLDAKRGRRIALISLSKGGADLKRAMALPGADVAFADVSAWVNISGIVHGTPLVDWLRQRPIRHWIVRLLLWWRGHPRMTLGDLRRGPGTVLDGWPGLPPHMCVVHVCGVPLRRHLTHPWAPRAYERLAPFGPNDGGGILLADALHFPGIVCPVWGADHYLEPPWDAAPILTGIIAAALAPRHATVSASQPSAPPARRSSA